MSKFKHTPGPWFYGIAYEPEKGPVPFDYASPGYYSNPGIIGADGQTVVGCDEYHVFSSPANARLIAAAPELLEAARAALHACWHYTGEDQDGCVDAAYDKLVAAIQKATGE